MQESTHIKRCKKLIQKKLDWGESKNWTNHNYDLLSEDILSCTGIKISARTLRRIFSTTNNYNPQIATKDALALYLDYRNWEEFVRSEKKNGAEVYDNPELTYRSNRRIIYNPFFWTIIVVVLLISSGFIVFFYPAIELELNKSRVVFQSNNMIGHAPHEATFYYDVSKIKSTNIFIDNNYYAEGSIIPVKKNMHFYSNTFGLPDYYAVKIIANAERISCVGIHVITKDWETIINDRYLPEVNCRYDGSLHIPAKVARSYSDSDFYSTEFRNIRDFGVNGDDMIFEARFRNSENFGGLSCNSSKFEIINTHGRLSFNFIHPGCDENKLKASFGDVLLKGEFNNLNTFFQDVSYWRVLKIKTKNKKVGVYLDNVQIYSVKYNDPLDEVKGISLKFSGSGAVDYIKLYDENENLVYSDDFNSNQVISHYN